MDFYETLNKIVLPVDKGKLSYAKALENEIINIGKILLQFNDKRFSEDFFKKLKEIISKNYTPSSDLILCAKHLEKEQNSIAQKILFDYLNTIKRFQFNLLQNCFTNSGLYRIRVNKDCLDRKDIFHPPKKFRKKAQETRFSHKREQSLYLSTSPHVCWLETEMPTNYWISMFLQTKETDKWNILFLLPPQEIDMKIFSPASIIDNSKGQEECLLDYFEQLPLIIACSFVKSKDKIEYKIPQMLMDWIKENKEQTKIVGVAYYSDSPLKKHQQYNGFNIAFPVIKYDKNGYDIFLQKAFKLSMPKEINLYKEMMPILNYINEYLNTYNIYSNQIDSPNWSIFQIINETLSYIENKILQNTLKDKKERNSFENFYVIFRLLINNFEMLKTIGVLDKEKKPIKEMNIAVQKFLDMISKLYYDISDPNVVETSKKNRLLIISN